MQAASRKDYLAGALIAGIGGFAVLQAQAYRMGDLERVGPGLFPTLVGGLMILIGALIAGSTSLAAGSVVADARVTDWRGIACVVAGPIMFIVCGGNFGLLPGAFACVFVSALGDRTATLRSAAALAAIITTAGILLFVFLLQIPFPIVQWPS